jgi:hypothetical protein
LNLIQFGFTLAAVVAAVTVYTVDYLVKLRVIYLLTDTSCFISANYLIDCREVFVSFPLGLSLSLTLEDYEDVLSLMPEKVFRVSIFFGK